jgi:hypothetical protein
MPPFLSPSKIHKKASTTTKVWNVYANANNTEKITKELHKVINQPNLRQYYSWKEFNSLQTGQQIAVIRLQNQFLAEFHSLLIHGLKPTDIGETSMWNDDKSIEQKFDETKI